MTPYRTRQALAAYRDIQRLREPRVPLTSAGRFWLGYAAIVLCVAWWLV